MVMIKIGYMNIFGNTGNIELFQSTMDNHIYAKIGTEYVRFTEGNFKIYHIFKEKSKHGYDSQTEKHYLCDVVNCVNYAVHFYKGSQFCEKHNKKDEENDK